MTPKEYNSCVDKFSDGLYRFLLKNIKDELTAQDLVQDTYLKLWEKHSEIDFTKAKSYIFTTGYHTMIDHVRKYKRLTLIDSEDSSELFNHYQTHTKTQEFFDTMKVIDLALDKLPSEQKAVVLLRDYEGYSYAEIGEITGLSESQVKVYIYRARVALKNFLVHADLVI